MDLGRSQERRNELLVEEMANRADEDKTLSFEKKLGNRSQTRVGKCGSQSVQEVERPEAGEETRILLKS